MILKNLLKKAAMKLSELEIKIQLESQDHFEEIFEACTKLYGPPASHFLQLDEYYDSADGQLKKQDLVIRIRSSGNQQTIALKSPRVLLPSGISNRIELEFTAAEGNKVLEQLKEQGLHTHEAAEKERWTFMHQDCEIVLDRLPFIGHFIEIEGPSEEAIHAIVKALKLSSFPVITKNYGELMKEKFRELNLPLTNIHATFATEKALR